MGQGDSDGSRDRAGQGDSDGTRDRPEQGDSDGSRDREPPPHGHGLRTFELGTRGTPLRATLVAAVLRGDKTGTACLHGEYEPLPAVGERFLLLDIDDRPIGIVETTEVRVLRIADCDLAFAVSEGEGFTTVAAWRAAHLAYWSAYWPHPITDDTLFVAERFRLVEIFAAP